MTRTVEQGNELRIGYNNGDGRQWKDRPRIESSHLRYVYLLQNSYAVRPVKEPRLRDDVQSPPPTNLPASSNIQ